MKIASLGLGACSFALALAASGTPALADGTPPVFPGAHLDARHSTPLTALYDTTAPAARVVAWYRAHLADRVAPSGGSSSYTSITHFIDPQSGDIEVDVMDMKPGFAPTRTTIVFNKH